MPGTKEIRNKISSVKSTQKITKAMEMVAASKMRRAQDRMRLSRPYAEKIRNVIGHLKKANPITNTRIWSSARRNRSALSWCRVIVVCAAHSNTNVFKTTLTMMREWQGKGAKVNLCLLGSKGVAFFRRLGAPVLASVTGLGDKPHVRDCSAR